MLKPLGTTYNRYTRTIEDWESGSLPSAYVGDRGAFAVQSSTVNSGDFALKGDSGGSFAPPVISRDDEPVSPGSKLTLECRRQSTSTGIVFGGPSAGGFSTFSGYGVSINSSGGIEIIRFDSGSLSGLKEGSQGIPDGAWQDLVAEWESDGTITGYAVDSNGSQIGDPTSATDTTYRGGVVGVVVGGPDGFFDNIDTEPLDGTSLGLATL